MTVSVNYFDFFFVYHTHIHAITICSVYSILFQNDVSIKAVESCRIIIWFYRFDFVDMPKLWMYSYPKSARNRGVIEVFCGVFLFSWWFNNRFFRGCRGFCHRTESDFSFFFIYVHKREKTRIEPVGKPYREFCLQTLLWPWKVRRPSSWSL